MGRLATVFPRLRRTVALEVGLGKFSPVHVAYLTCVSERKDEFLVSDSAHLIIGAILWTLLNKPRREARFCRLHVMTQRQSR
jgi:hypothetical protein